jgi:hypothetical protein
MDWALRTLKASPTDATKLEAAETIIRYLQREKRGDIQLALHLLRELLHANPTDRHILDLSHVAETLQRA